jgi:hypothetical protein
LTIVTTAGARAYLPSFGALAIGFAYLVGPIDLIPDKTPYVGHLDEAGFVLVSVGVAWWAAPPALASRLRRGVITLLAGSFGGCLFRLCLGRWPERAERGQFAVAMCDNSVPMPALLRAMHAVPASQREISRLLLFDLQRDGRLPPPPPLGTMAVPIAPQSGDPLQFWQGRKVSFLHIEKTAGTALANGLTERFHPLQIDQDPNRSMPPHLRSAFPTSALETIRDSKLVWGHYDLPSLLRLDPERRIVTMLRDPRARILSLYRFWRSYGPASVDTRYNREARLAHENDLLDFLRLDDPSLHDCIDNLYVRRLTGLYATLGERDPLRSDPMAALAKAREGLRRLAFVGVVERMEESLAGLSAALGTSIVVKQENKGETNARERPDLFRAADPVVVTPEIELELDRLTRLDRVIYEECARPFETRRAA